MRRLATDRLEMQNPQLARSSSFRRKIAAAPLIAGLIAGVGCSDAELPNDCRLYNETTITLNLATDGFVPDLRTIESLPQGSFLLPGHIDFINEAHAIASGGMPPGTMATQSPSYCLMGGDDGNQRSAYAQQSDMENAQRGLYVPENQSLISITLINLVNHEIGHLQPGNPVHGSEVLSQLNEYEQKLAGFALLSRSGADPDQLIRWSYHEAHSGLFQKLRRTLESGRGVEGGEPLNAYDEANMFLFARLGENGGDIASIRTEFRSRVADGSLEAELESASSVFLQAYSTANIADLFVDVRIRLINAIQSQYGEGEAYALAHSALLAPGMAYGLMGMNCYETASPAPADYFPCSSETCTEIGADISRPVSVSLCCIGADFASGEAVFSKSSIEASGVRYEKEGGTVELGGFRYGALTELTASPVPLGLDEPCG